MQGHMMQGHMVNAGPHSTVGGQTTFAHFHHFWPVDFWPSRLFAQRPFGPILVPTKKVTTFGPDHIWPAHPLTIHNVKMTLGKIQAAEA